MFDALVLEKNDDFKAAVTPGRRRFPARWRRDRRHSLLHAQLQDGLAITNRSPVVRDWPMVAGIDGAGIVRASEHPPGGPATP